MGGLLANRKLHQMNIPYNQAYSCQRMPSFITFAGLPTAML